MTEERDYTESIAKVAGSMARLVGMNPVQTQWRVRRWFHGLAAEKARTVESVSHLGYRHKNCGGCGALIEGDARVCPICGARPCSRATQILDRIGLRLPRVISVSGMLGAAMIVAYAAVMLTDPEGNIVSPSNQALLVHGARLPLDWMGGQWWRLLSCVFLHAGIWHIGFNLYALSIIGPEVETIYGRLRMFVFFVFTGLVGSVAGIFLLGGLGIGASGAVMGLIGVAAGWGQRDGTTIGRRVRNQMFQWLIYTTVFGFMIGADHAAHIGGFLSGALLGYLVPGHLRKSPAPGPVWLALGALCLAACLVAIWFILIPMPLGDGFLTG